MGDRPIKHGSRTGYNRGCRCPDCLAVMAARARRYRARKRGLEPGEGRGKVQVECGLVEPDAGCNLRPSSEPSSPPESSLPPVVTVLPTKTAPTASVGPGEWEQKVIDECGTLSAAASHPSLVATARAMARVLDDRRQVTTHPSAGRQLMTAMEKLRSASIGRAGRLASVSAMLQRQPKQDAG